MRNINEKKTKLDFKKKVYMLSLLVLLRLDKSVLSKKFLETLLDDEKNMNYHYQVWVNLSFYRGKDNLPIYDDFYSDYKKEFNRIADYFISNLNLMNIGKRKEKNIAFVVHQLKVINHSATKLILDYAKNLKKIYPKYNIKIFVEDVINYGEMNKILPFIYESNHSSKFKDYHQQYIQGVDVEIYYSKKNVSRNERIKDLIKKIDNFAPNVIWSMREISLIPEILYDFYPVLYLSNGGNYTYNSADVYAVGDKNGFLKNNKKYKLLNPDEIYEFKAGIEFIETDKNIDRVEYNISSNDFVLVTVGNRLDKELDSDTRFIDSICDILIKNEKIKWIIVGPKKLEYLQKNYNHLYGNSIIRINYKEDLLALYKICDVYINPDRNGGGYSIAMAMNEALPIVIFNRASDGINWVGKENGVDKMQDYIQEIKKLFNNLDYRKEKGLSMKKRIQNNFSFENSIKELKQLFEITKNNFLKRLN
ncbi:glycosyltransferase [Halanaerobacter jeridensis]|uniref:Glycosyltransferase involved in cell wall biosynthesis n=1 Tax=Halanaerobacter jeridensis TaxID=706427 RepID=A0A939BSL3_9FIRM|nr:glycosyltransferase [Halanaerobacter jeridensis]MBM7557271.1 glycosyltransferase involved in cell wall biosynthesis [Halanaerobacter jeridensis]